MVHYKDIHEAAASCEMSTDEIYPEHVDDDMFLKKLALFYLKL